MKRAIIPLIGLVQVGKSTYLVIVIEAGLVQVGKSKSTYLVIVIEAGPKTLSRTSFKKNTILFFFFLKMEKVSEKHTCVTASLKLQEPPSPPISSRHSRFNASK